MSLFQNLVLPVLIGVVVTTLEAAEPLALSKQYWQDGSFLKAFNGSYRVNARIEPTLTSSERALLVKVQGLMRSGKRKDALALLNKSAEVKKSAALLYNRANIYFELGELENARKAYLATVKLYPSFRRAHANLGMVLLREENYDAALSSLVMAVELGDMSGSTMGMLGYCHLQNDHYSSALQAYRMAQLSQPKQVDWQAGVAQCLSEIGQNNEAIALLKEVVDLRPLENSYQLLLVNALLKDNQDEAAVVTLEWLRHNERLDVEHWTLLAQLHARGGSGELAKVILQELIPRLDQELIPGYLTTVEIVFSLGEWSYTEDLLSSIPEGLELAQEVQHRYQRLTALVLAKLNKPGAEGILNLILKDNPLDGEALLQLGLFYSAAEKYEHAAMCFDRAEPFEYVHYRTLLAYSQMLVAQNLYKLAIEKLEKADALKSTPEQRKYLLVLKNIAREY